MGSAKDLGATPSARMDPRDPGPVAEEARREVRTAACRVADVARGTWGSPPRTPAENMPKEEDIVRR